MSDTGLPDPFIFFYAINSSADYWTGVFQPSQGDFRWASDCSTAYYTSHLEKTWDSGKTCFKFHKDDHDGIKDGCSSKRAFMCEKPLPAGTLISVQSQCETTYISEPYCNTCIWVIGTEFYSDHLGAVKYVFKMDYQYLAPVVSTEIIWVGRSGA